MDAPLPADGPQVWEVVGGREQQGILVRTGVDLNSPREPERLSTGARLAQLELVGQRLHFRRLTGTGPPTGWISTHLSQKKLVVPVPAAEESARQEAARGPPIRFFDLLRGPVDLRNLGAGGPTEALQQEPNLEGLGGLLQQYGVVNFDVESILRTELGRDKFFVRTTDPQGKEERLFVGRVAEDGPRPAAVEASITAFLTIAQHCRPERVSVTQFKRKRDNMYLHDRYIVSPAHGASNWGRSAQDRLMLATAIGELHRASARAFAKGLPAQIEKDMVEGEVGLGVLEWGLGVDYSDSGLSVSEIGRIKFIVSSLRMLDRPDRIRDLPKSVVHTDLQFKNLCRSVVPGCNAPVLVDFKLGHRASRIWDLYFILCGDDLCSLLPCNAEMTDDFIAAIRHYEEVSEMQFSEEETFLLMNTIMMKAIFNSCFFGSFQSHLPGSRKKCRAAFDTMEWIIARKDYFRSIF